MNKGRLAFLLLTGFLFTSLSAPQAAAGDNVWNMAESDEYGRKAVGQLGRGLLNAASCFVDLAVQTVEKTKEGPAIVGTLAGIGSGAGCTILRAGSGIIDVATFWIPDFKGLPVSRSYSNCLEEESKFYSGSTGVYAGDEGYQASSAVAVAPAPQAQYVAPTSFTQAPIAEAPAVQEAVAASAPAHDPAAYVKGNPPAAKVHDPKKYVK